MKTTLISISFGLIIVLSSTQVKAQSKDTNYNWINHSRIFIVDGYTYPISPRLEFDAEKLAETMLDMHANVLRIATSGYSNWLIPGTKFKVAKDLGSRDILAESIAACKPRGIKVVPYLRTGGTIPTSIMNPEWAYKVIPSGNIQSRMDMGEMVSPLCWNTSYREAFYDLVKIIMSKYDIDGIYFDTWRAFYFFGGREKVCYCEGCQKGFKEASGLDLPYREDNVRYTPEDLRIIGLYRDWYKEELNEVFGETKRIIKSFKDIPLIYNINSPTAIENEDTRILSGSDAFLYERGRSMLERAEGVSLATAHGLAVWPYVGTYDPFPRIPHYKYELGQEIFTSVAFGGSPILYHTYFFVEHPESRGIIKDAFRILDDNDQFIKGFNPYKFCAVIWNSTDPPGHSVKEFLWESNARLNSLGSFSSCLNNHIQTTSLLKQNLDNFEILSKYKVLCLPDICYLSDKQITNITRFVENGGGLVLTYSTSLYNEKGERQPDFALGKLAKIRYNKPDGIMSEKISRNLNFGGGWDLYMKARPGQEIIKSPLADGLIPTHLFETIEVLPGGKIITDIVAGPGDRPISPGLVVSSYGKGKVAYIPAALDAMFLQTGIREFSDFLKNVIQYVSPDGIPYEIDAPPSTLITNMTGNGNKSVIHLITWTGSQSERMWQNVYYIPPVENVTIKFSIPPGKKIKNINTIIPVDFTQTQEKNILYITLPRVDKYQSILVEMK